MAERAKKVTELTSLTNAAANDLFIIIDSVGTSNVETKSITVSNLFANVSTAVALKSTVAITGVTTTSSNVNVTGTVSATAFSGNGASVTSVDSVTVGGNTVADIISAANAYSDSAYSNAVSKVIYTGYAVDSINRNVMSANGTDGYLISSYEGNNPDLYVICGTTVSFDLTNLSSHPFNILDESNNLITDNITHISSNGTITTGSGAQSQTSGVLYWQLPVALGSATFHYLCNNHSSMYGNVVIKDITTL